LSNEELDVKKALKTAKENLRSIVGEVKDTVATVRREEPLPVRRRIKRRKERRKKRRETRRQES